MITKEQVIEAQNSWAEGIIEIGSLKDESKLNERVIDFLDGYILMSQVQFFLSLQWLR